MSNNTFDKLIQDIQYHMAKQRTFLNVEYYKNIAIDELEFLIVLLNDINNEESKKTAKYIRQLIQKSKQGLYQIGD